MQLEVSIEIFKLKEKYNKK